MDKRPALSNDNAYHRHFFRGSDYLGSRERLLPFLPVAQELIKRFCTEPFRHDPTSSDYGFLEYQLCTLLEGEEPNRAFRQNKIESIARFLGCSPLLLHNDPDLPF